MKIGILSMQRVINHGSFWQAYLLKELIIKLGHQVEFIDIIPGKNIRSVHKKFTLDKINRIPYRLFFLPIKVKKIREWQKKSLGCSDYPNYSDNYDCIIIGSDEVFNFAQYTSWGFSKQLNGSINNENVNSYAASFGSSTYDDVEKYNLRSDLIEAFSNLKHISVRDENSQKIMSCLLPKANIQRHLDPVLVGDLPVPKYKMPKTKYIAVYAYDFRFNDKSYINLIRDFAKRQKLKVYSVGFYQTWVDKNINCDPVELLEYFVKAEYIITDTFHGSIFSIKCHKQFVTFPRRGSGGNDKKIISLLGDLNLLDRIVEKADEIEDKLSKVIDYDFVEKRLMEERRRTEKYLLECINGEGII